MKDVRPSCLTNGHHDAALTRAKAARRGAIPKSGGCSNAPQLTITGPLPHMHVTNGLYTIRIEMKDGKRGRATGVIVLLDGQIRGGDTYFYYTGSYSFKNGKWRGELITHQHTEAVGKNLAFGGREVSCGFTGVYSDGEAEVEGTALVGKTSVSFGAVLKLQAPL